MPRLFPSDPQYPIALTVAITRAYLSHNAMAARDLPALILTVHSALAGAQTTVAEEITRAGPRTRRAPSRSGRTPRRAMSAGGFSRRSSLA